MFRVGGAEFGGGREIGCVGQDRASTMVGDRIAGRQQQALSHIAWCSDSDTIFSTEIRYDRDSTIAPLAHDH